MSKRARTTADDFDDEDASQEQLLPPAWLSADALRYFWRTVREGGGRYRAKHVMLLSIYAKRLADLDAYQAALTATTREWNKAPSERGYAKVRRLERAISREMSEITRMTTKLGLGAARSNRETANASRFALAEDGSAIRPRDWPEGKFFNARPGLRDCDRGDPDGFLVLWPDTETQRALFGGDPPEGMLKWPDGTPLFDWQGVAGREKRNARERRKRAVARAEKVAATTPKGKPV